MIEGELLIEHLGEIKTHALKKIWLQRHCPKRKEFKRDICDKAKRIKCTSHTRNDYGPYLLTLLALAILAWLLVFLHASSTIASLATLCMSILHYHHHRELHVKCVRDGPKLSYY